MAAKYAREVKAILTQRCFAPPPPETVELCEVVYEAAMKTAEALKPSHNSDYAKCADEILLLDLADEVINKRGCIVSILRRHFA